MISIIIPSYNHGNKITKAIESCNLINCLKEIVVVNDGSTDDTEKVVKNFSNVKLINQHNQGPGNARNCGISSSKYSNVLLLDADDEFLFGVNKLLEYINDNDIVYGNVLNSNGYLDKLINENKLTNKLFLQYNPMTSVFLFKKQVWETINGFSEDRDLYEDWDFLARAFYKNFKFKYVDTDVFIYNRSSNGMLGTKNKNHGFHKKLTINNINKFKK